MDAPSLAFRCSDEETAKTIQLLADLIQTLRTAHTFDDSADAFLKKSQRLVEDGLWDGDYVGQGMVLRSMVHLRPFGEYQSLHVLHREERLAATLSKESWLPSMTAWEWIDRYQIPLEIDLVAKTIRFHSLFRVEAIHQETVLPHPSSQTAFTGNVTAKRLVARNVTHLLVVPLFGPTQETLGMVSIEVNCQPAIGKALLPTIYFQYLSLLSEVAGPFFIIHPQAPLSQEMAGDELLPIIGQKMKSILSFLKVFATHEETLLISGETGVGKSRLALWCHAHSAHQDHNFEILDLSTIPEDMQLPELFGWKKGAFTGAIQDYKGALVRAENGTLFIDEIDKLSLKAQAGLLQVLESRQYRPLGNNRESLKANVRFIVGTNANLKESVQQGRFREDLYYRINVIPVHLPTLRERRDEIPHWATYMVQRKHRELEKLGTVFFDAEALVCLEKQTWPGNLRQLDNTVRRAYLIALSDVRAKSPDLVLKRSHLEQALALDFPHAQSSSSSLGESLKQAASAFVEQALDRFENADPLDLNSTDCFRGLVLLQAMERLQDKKQVYQMFGKDKSIKNRNYHRELKQELQKANHLFQSLGISEVELPKDWNL